MPYLIDGHNLIAQFPGLSLHDADDEAKLVQILRAFCARSGRKAVVFFDQGVLGGTDPASAGGLTVRFVRPPRTADEAIHSFLKRLKGEARNWTVVSSDLAVQSSAKQASARALPSRDFASALSAAPGAAAGEKPEPDLSAEQIEDWERLFLHQRRKGGGVL